MQLAFVLWKEGLGVLKFLTLQQARFVFGLMVKQSLLCDLAKCKQFNGLICGLNIGFHRIMQ